MPGGLQPAGFAASMAAHPMVGVSARRWQDCVVLAQALLAGGRFQDIPAMVAIAERSIFAARAGKW